MTESSKRCSVGLSALQSQGSEGDELAQKHVELLKISIQARIEDFDEFYKVNFADPRISFFEKQKFRLRKLLFELGRAANGTESPAVCRDLEVQFARPRDNPPVSPIPKSNTTIKQPQKEQKREQKSPLPASQVIYNVKLNKGEYNRIIEKKAQTRLIEANK